MSGMTGNDVAAKALLDFWCEQFLLRELCIYIHVYHIHRTEFPFKGGHHKSTEFPPDGISAHEWKFCSCKDTLFTNLDYS